MDNRIVCAAIQMVSGSVLEQNIQAAYRLIEEAVARGANWVLLPEYWALMGMDEQDKVLIAEPFGEGRLQDVLARWAVEFDVVLFGGSIPLRSVSVDKVCNTMLVYGRDGGLLSRYDKIHLFGFSGSHGERYSEAETICAGTKLPALCCDHWSVAQGICYDLRFPELFRAQMPFEVLMLPAAFTYTTGMAHWLLLLRARAVENQCYVVAAGQGGQHENGRRTFGHSVIINPWGEIMAMCEEGEGVALAALDWNELMKVRTRLPAYQHRVW